MSDKDIIYREDAIDAIADTIVRGESLGYGIAEDILYSVPSVESKIIHCKDCIWHNKNINQCNRQVCAVMYADDFCSYGERRGEQNDTD